MDTKSTSTTTDIKYVWRENDTVFLSKSYPLEKKEALLSMNHDLFREFFMFQLKKDQLYCIAQSSSDTSSSCILFPHEQAKAEAIGNDRKLLKKQLLSAKSVLSDWLRPSFKKYKYDFKRKQLISDDGLYALQWYADGKTSVGSVKVVNL